MKILLIDVNCKGSSTGKIVYDLYSSLNLDTVAICYGRGIMIHEPNIYKFGLDWETNIHAVLARLTGYNGCYSYFSTKRLIDFIDTYKPDIIHIHELHAYFVNIKPLIEYIKEKEIPVVWTFHCEYMYTGKCGYAYDCEKWKSTCGQCPAIKNYPKSLFFDHTAAMLKMKKKLLMDLNFIIVTPSQWLADRVKQSFLKEKAIRVINNGIDTDTIFYPRNTIEISSIRNKYSLDNRKVILSVAPNIMEERKGGKKALEIAKLMPDVQFILVGVDEDKKYSDNVWMIKRTKKQDELARWYSIADLFILLSKKESYSMTCAEALCCGTPVIGLKCGAPETVFKEPYARFVAYGDKSGGVQQNYYRRRFQHS